MSIPETIHRWDCSLRYRGYLIVPVQAHAEEGVVGTAVSVFDPFGEKVGFSPKVQTISRFEDLWEEGKGIVDRDVELCFSIEVSPELTAIWKRAGAIA